MFLGGVSIAALVAASVPAWIIGGAVADFDFKNDRYYGPKINVSRASSAYIDDSAGNWTLVPPNTARRSNKGLLVEGAQTNSIRNNSMQGAVAGTPGTLPTNWGQSQNIGITPKVIGVGVENGVDYIDLQYAGTTTGSGQHNLFLETATSAASASGQLWSGSVFVKVSGGSLANVSSLNLVIQGNNSSGSALEASVTNTNPTSASLGTQRYTVNRTFSNANTAFTNTYIQLNANSGMPLNFTLRIGWPQLEQWNTSVTTVGGASSPIRTTGTAATRAADVVTATLANGVGPNLTFSVVHRPALYPVLSRYLALIGDQASGNCFFMRSAGGTPSNAVPSGKVSGADFTLPNPTNAFPADGSRHAIAYAGAPNDYAAVSDSGSIQSSTSPGALPSMNRLELGGGGAFGGQSFHGYIERFAVLPYRASNDNLQRLSNLATYGG